MNPIPTASTPSAVSSVATFHTNGNNPMPIAIVVAVGGVVTSGEEAFAAGVAPGQATAVQREQAQTRFARGKEKLAKGDHAGALVEFNASLDIVASPNTRLFVGRCLRESGRLVEAYVELGRTEIEAKELAKDDPRYEKAGQSAHEERAKLEPKLGFVEVEVAHADATTTLKVELCASNITGNAVHCSASFFGTLSSVVRSICALASFSDVTKRVL